MTILGILGLSLASKCQVSVERIVLDLESEAMRGPGSNATEGNILSRDFRLVCEKPRFVGPLMSLDL